MRYLWLLILVLSPSLKADDADSLIKTAFSAYESQDFATAREHFLRAQQEMHKQEGVWTLSQLPIVDHLSEIALRDNDIRTADRVQRYRLKIVSRNFGPDSAEVARAMGTLGNYQQMLARYTRADELFSQASQIDTPGEHNPAASAILFNQYLKGFCCKDRLLQDARRAIHKAGNLDSAERAALLIDLGDVAIMAGEPDASARMYRDAVHVSEPVADRLAKPAFLGISRKDRMTRTYVDAIHKSRHYDQQRLFADHTIKPGQLVGSPMPMCESRLQDVVGGDDYGAYRIRLGMEIHTNGRARKIRVIESNAPTEMDRLVKKLYGISRFRPASNGENKTQTIEITQTFGPIAIHEVTDFPHSTLATTHGCFAMSQYFDAGRESRIATVQ